MSKKRIKPKKEMCNYYVKEQKVMTYSKVFFDMLCSCSMFTNECSLLDENVLPLSCIKITDEQYDYYYKEGFFKACKKQACIKIGIDTKKSKLGKKLKQKIKRNVISYCLWLLELPYGEDELEFWCLSYVFDGGACKELSPENKEYYDLFKVLYNSYVVDLDWNTRRLIVGEMVTSISKTTRDEYTDSVLKIVKKAKEFTGEG